MLRTLFVTCCAALLAIASTACSAPPVNPTSPSTGPLLAAAAAKGHTTVFKVYVWSTDVVEQDDHYVEGATVTVTLLDPPGGTFTSTTVEPKGEARFLLPGDVVKVHVGVEAVGLCPQDAEVTIGNPPTFAFRLYACP